MTLDTDFTLYKWRRAQTFFELSTGPGLGVWVSSAETGAVRFSRRDWTVNLGIDYVARADDWDEVNTQVRLAASAIMRVVDGLATGSPSDDFIRAAEDEAGSIVVDDLSELLMAATDRNTGPIYGGCRIVVPVTVREPLP